VEVEVASLVAQRDDRIDARGAACRQEAREYRDEQQRCGYAHIGERVRSTRLAQRGKLGLQEFRDASCDQKANRQTDSGEAQALRQDAP
jgi:hypothetical protein